MGLNVLGSGLGIGLWICLGMDPAKGLGIELWKGLGIELRRYNARRTALPSDRVYGLVSFSPSI